MAIKQDVLQEVCTVAKLQLQDLYPEAKTLFVPHQTGTLQDIVVSKDFDMPKHPAAQIAQMMLEKNSLREDTGFIGLAVSQKSKWLGLSRTDSILSVLNINTDHFNDEKELRRSLYHYVWHAIDLMEVRKRPDYANKFKSGPMIPRRSPMNMARLNLQADAFSSTMCALLGDDSEISFLADKRASDSIAPAHLRKAEDYPFPIAVESVEYAFEALKAMKPTRMKYMNYARQLALEVGRSFDDENILQWWGFAEPAQEMAWRNFSPEMILGCAINTSEDPFIRSVGLLVSDITGKEALNIDETMTGFNAFAKKEDTRMLHRELMEKAFEEAVSKGVYEESGQPLIIAANKQNEDLSDGVFLGWCANALQAAARAFDTALKSGAPPAQAARMEFEGGKNNPEFEQIEKIGQAAIEQKRKGYAVTLGNIAEICAQNPMFSPVLNSIKMTMKDPAFVQKLETANDFAPKGAAPKGIAPKAPSPSTPSVSAPAFSTPGLGGSAASRNAAMNAARQAAAKEAQAQSGKKTGEEDRA